MKTTFFILLQLLFCLNSFSQTEKTPLSEANKAIVDDIMNDLPDSVQIAIAIIEDGKTNYYGFQKINRSTIEIENQHAVFQIGSITKTFTGLLYANALVDKTIKPKRKLSKDLDGAKILKKVRYQNLANHTSGFGRLPDNFVMIPPENPYKNYTVAKLAEFCQNKKELGSEPGKTFLYSNTGFALLALGMTKVLEVDYPVALQEQIFDKYDMKESSVERDILAEQMVIPRDEFGKRTNYWDFWGIFGFGEIYSSTSDLSKYVKTYFKAENLAQKEMLKSTFVKSESLDIGISWLIFKQEAKVPLYFHDGATNGFTSSICFDPLSQSGVVVLSNLSPQHESGGKMSNSSIELMKTILK